MEIKKRVYSGTTPYNSEWIDVSEVPLNEDGKRSYGLELFGSKEPQKAFTKMGAQICLAATAPGSAGNDYSFCTDSGVSGSNLDLSVDFDAAGKTVVVNRGTDADGNFNVGKNMVSNVVDAINAAITDGSLVATVIGNPDAYLSPFGATNLQHGNDIGVPAQYAQTQILGSDSNEADAALNPGEGLISAGSMHSKVTSDPNSQNQCKVFDFIKIVVSDITTDGSIAPVDIIVNVN